MCVTYDPPLGVLLYLTDGILPLLFAFYNVFFELSGSGRPKQLEVTRKALTALLVSLSSYYRSGVKVQCVHMCSTVLCVHAVSPV